MRSGFKLRLMNLVIATGNAHKTREFREMLGSEFAISDLKDYPAIPLIDETGASLEENATLKAVAVSKVVPGRVLGDDSGLEVDALGGAPGVYSARYAGSDANDQRNREKLLDELANCCREQRTARFRCVLALAEDGKLIGTVTGAVEGRIIDEIRGTHGFGYDSLFVPLGFEQTFAELPAATKNTLSHRANAVKALREMLRRLPPST